MMKFFCPNCRHQTEFSDLAESVDGSSYDCPACGEVVDLSHDPVFQGDLPRSLTAVDSSSEHDLSSQHKEHGPNLPVPQPVATPSEQETGMVPKKLTLAGTQGGPQVPAFKGRKQRTGTEPHLPVLKLGGSAAEKDTSLPVLKQSFNARMSTDDADLPAVQREGDDPTGYFVRDKTMVGEQRKRMVVDTPARRRIPLLLLLAVVGIGATGYMYVDKIRGGLARFGVISPAPAKKEGHHEKSKLIQQAYQEYQKDTYAGYLESIRINSGIASSGRPDDQITAKARLVQGMSAIQIRFPGAKETTDQLKRTLYDLDQIDKPGFDIAKARILSQIASGNTSAADKALQTYVQSYPKDSDARVYQGWLSWKRQDVGAAENAYQKALSINPDSVAAAYGMLQVLALSGDRKEALGKATSFAADHPKHCDAQLLAMNLAIRVENMESARGYLSQCDSDVSQIAKSQSYQVNHGKGMIASIEGNLPEARIIFEDQLSRHPNDPKTIVAFADLEIGAKNYDQAIALIERIPIADRRENIDITISEARARMAMGHVDAAASIIEPIHKLNPKRLDLMMAMAALRAYQGNLKAAKSLYQSALVKNDGAYDALLDYARILLNTGQHKQALSLLNSTKPQVSSIRYYLLYAEVMLASGQTRSAETSLRVLSLKNPDHDRIQYLYAKVLFLNGNYDRALARVLELQKRVPKYNGLKSLLGSIHGARGDFERSSKLFDEALAINPTDSLRLLASHSYVKNGQYDLVLTLTQQVLKNTPESAESFTLRALARLGKHAYKESLFEIERAIRTDQAAFNYAVRAQIQLKLGRPLEAILSYDKALEDDPKNPDLRFQKARLLVLNGTVKDGLLQLESILKTYPKYASASLFAGIASEDLSARNRAKRYYLRAIRLDPELWEAHYRLGAYYLDENQGRQAFSHLDRASKHSSSDDYWYLDALYHLGKAAQRLGNDALARKTYKSFIGQAPAGDGRVASARRYISVGR